MPLKPVAIRKKPINEDLGERKSSQISEIISECDFDQVKPIHKFSEYIDEDEFSNMSKKKDSASEIPDGISESSLMKASILSRRMKASIISGQIFEVMGDDGLERSQEFTRSPQMVKKSKAIKK